LAVVILDFQRHGGIDPAGRIEQQADERAIAQANQRIRLDGIQQPARLIGR
jgi:hypothetical protein